MADRINFEEMYGLPSELECPRCHKIQITRFNESSMFEFDFPKVMVYFHCGDCEDEGYKNAKYVTDSYWYEFTVELENINLVPMR